MKLLLKEIAEIQSGYQSTGKIMPNSDGSHRLIQAKDMREHHGIDFSVLVRFQPVRKPELYLVRKNNILFQGRGFNHHAIHIEDCPEHVLAASTFYIIRIKSSAIRPAYLTWWLNQFSVQNELQEKAGSSYMSFVPIKVLADIKIELPLLEIQDKIVALIVLKNREAGLLDDLKKHKEKLINQLCMNKIFQAGVKR